MKVIFWNINKQEINTQLSKLILAYKPEIVVLAEFENKYQERLLELLRNTDYRFTDRIGCNRIHLLTTYNKKELHLKTDDERYSIHEIRIQNTNPVLLCSLHLQSKLYNNDVTMIENASDIKSDIEKIEQICGHKNTIVVGDFNMNPFDLSMISRIGFNAISFYQSPKKLFRTSKSKKYDFFYNPSWNLLGDYNQIPGTYYHKSPTSISLYWNTLDQVLFRPCIAENYVQNSLKVITEFADVKTINNNGLPLISDHLPISFNYNL